MGLAQISRPLPHSPHNHPHMNREILRLAIPNILSNVSVPLLSSVDTLLMGRLSAEHVAAVGIGSMIFNFIYWNFGFLRMGTTGITAQAYGRQSERDMMLTLGRALVVALGLALLIMLLQKPLGALSFRVMGVEPSYRPLVADYFYTRIWAAPATLALYALMGWFFGMQNAWYPLLLTIFINLVNIACSYVFVAQWGMEAHGVALGTVVAQVAGLALALVLWGARYRHLARAFAWAGLRQIEELRHFLVINRDIFLRTVALTFAFGFFYQQSALLGVTTLAVNTILLQYFNWMSYGVDGFAYAAESVVGKYAGRGDAARTHRAIRLSLWWGMVLAVLFAGSYWWWGEPILRVFTDKADLQAAALPYLWWMAVLPFFGAPSFIWDGIFIGLTASRAMRNSMLLALAVFLAVYYPLRPTLANDALWLAMVVFMAARGTIQWWMYRRRGLALD